MKSKDLGLAGSKVDPCPGANCRVSKTKGFSNTEVVLVEWTTSLPELLDVWAKVTLIVIEDACPPNEGPGSRRIAGICSPSHVVSSVKRRTRLKKTMSLSSHDILSCSRTFDCFLSVFFLTKSLSAIAALL